MKASQSEVKWPFHSLLCLIKAKFSFILVAKFAKVRKSSTSVSGGWWLEAGLEAAYLGAVSWVVYNSCLGFLGGGRRHFTMQGGYVWGGGTSKRCQGIPKYSTMTDT